MISFESCAKRVRAGVMEYAQGGNRMDESQECVSTREIIKDKLRQNFDGSIAAQMMKP